MLLLLTIPHGLQTARQAWKKSQILPLHFFKMNDIQINPSKTEVIAINSKDLETGNHNWFNFDATICIPIRAKNQLIRYLRIWASADNSNKHTINCVDNEINSIIQFATQKAIPNKTAAYIINAVILPTIEYHT